MYVKRKTPAARYRKNVRRTSSKTATKNIVSLVRSVVKGTAETGSSYYNSGATFLVKQTPKTWNIVYNTGLTNSSIGTTIDSGLIKGDSIQPIGLSIKGLLQQGINENALITIAVIKSSTYLTTSSFTADALMKIGDTANHLPRFNSDEVSVLFKKTFKI